jgi:hypothetical protein
MASFTIQRTAVCVGGNHHTVTAGGLSPTAMLTPSDVTGPVTDEDLTIAIAILLRAKKQLDGLTNGQLLAAAIAGIEVTL